MTAKIFEDIFFLEMTTTVVRRRYAEKSKEQMKPVKSTTHNNLQLV